MPKYPSEDHAAGVKAMFARIARHYDLMNRLMTAGQDKRWRQRLIDMARITPGSRVLDLGAGTGDLAAEIARRDPSGQVTAGDYTLEMMRRGKANPKRKDLPWVNLDALLLPFAAGSFDAVLSGYLMRNVSDVRRSWEEQHRVLKPGGVAVCLDTTPPPPGWQYFPVRFYLRVILPLLGWLVTGDRAAYTYLPLSTQRFLEAEALKAAMGEAGFTRTGFRRFAFKTMAFHWGYKESSEKILFIGDKNE